MQRNRLELNDITQSINYFIYIKKHKNAVLCGLKAQ